MTDITTFLLIITIFVLAIFVGTEVISKVPTVLHTPLMSGTNFIHGIVLMAAMLTAGLAFAGKGWAFTLIGFFAVVLGTLNLVGGYVVTDRMLEMFKPKQQPPKEPTKK